MGSSDDRHDASPEPRHPEREGRAKLEHLARLCGGAALVVIALVVPYRIYVGGYLNHVSGAWAALADDAAHGVVYRPLLSDLGFGGTRNFPLHFVVHGLLAALGIPLRAAGHLVSFGAGALLVVGAATALRRTGASASYAWAAGMLAVASRTAVMGMAGIRGDLLPVALGVMGIALVPRSEQKSILASSALLGAALVAKPTLAWAPVAAVVALFVARKFGQAVRLALTTGAVALAGLALASVASGGAMLASFRACASGGGFSIEILRGALGYVRPGDALWILGGAGLTLLAGRSSLVNPVGVASLVSIPTTLFVLASRGTHVNHLVDASAIGAVAIASAAWQVGNRRKLESRLLGAATVVGLLEIVALDGMLLRRGELDAAASSLPPGSTPVLSEQPWVPLLAGERAYLLDPYNLLQVRRQSKALDEDFRSRLEGCGFRAVVLLGRAETSEPWYESVHFGSGFRERLLEHYTLSRVAGGHAIYLPRCGKPHPVPAPAVPGETILEREQRPSALRAFVQRLRGR